MAEIVALVIALNSATLLGVSGLYAMMGRLNKRVTSCKMKLEYHLGKWDE